MFPWFLVGKIGLVVVALGLLYGGYKVVGNHFKGIQNLETTISNERDRANRAEVSLGALEMTVDLREQFALDKATIRADSQARIDAIRDETNKDKAVLTDRERITKLSVAKPKLMERMGNRATEKIFNDLEVIYNN